MLAAGPINPDRLYTTKELMQLEGISRSEYHRRRNKGQYRSVKDGRLAKTLGREIIKRRDENLRPLETPTLSAISPGG
jgi:hypothetical protein